jgi:hypothetical protein
MTCIAVWLWQFDMGPCGSGLAIISLLEIGCFWRMVFGEWLLSEIGRLEIVCSEIDLCITICIENG